MACSMASRQASQSVPSTESTSMPGKALANVVASPKRTSELWALMSHSLSCTSQTMGSCRSAVM